MIYFMVNLMLFLLSSTRLRSDLAEVTDRHEQTVKEMRNEVAEMKSLLIRVLQQRSVPSLPSVRLLQDRHQDQHHSPEHLNTNETQMPTRRSASSRSRRKKTRRQLGYPSDDEVGNYQGLLLADEADGESNELPSVRVLASRASSNRQHKEDQDHT